MTTLSPLLTFREAFDTWIGSRILHEQGAWTNARFISRRTERDLRQYADQVEIRKEVGLIVRLMKIAGAWNEELDANVEMVRPVENDLPQALTPDEQHRWLHTAGSRQKWRVVYWYSLVGFQTSAGTNEMRALRIGDVDLYTGTIQIRNEGAKNKFRVRTIPLMTPELVNALAGLVERARRLGATAPHCYLFPRHITRDKYDPLRPMSVWGLRKPWDEVRSATGLERFTPYDTRHTGITRMAEAGVPLPVAMSIAGHMSPRTQQHYISISMASKRSALAQTFAAVQWNGAPPEKKQPVGLPLEEWHRAAVSWK